MKIIEEQKKFTLTEEDQYQEGFRSHSSKTATISFVKTIDSSWEFNDCDFNFSGKYSFNDWMFLGKVSKFIDEKLYELKKL